MAKLFDTGATLERLRNRYRLVVMNDDTYEEVVTFRLSRLSVYIALCTIFVVLVGFTVALIVFTPLKYYIPGYGSASERKELVALKMKVDSLEQQSRYDDQYLLNLRKVLDGNAEAKYDTTQLDLPREEKTTD